MMREHRRKNCPNEVVCYDCRNTGHKKGDPECPSVKEIMAAAEAESKENENDERKSDGENSDDDKDKSESEDEMDKQERRMNQVFREAFTLAEDWKSRSKDLSNPKTSTQNHDGGIPLC